MERKRKTKRQKQKEIERIDTERKKQRDGENKIVRERGGQKYR